MHHQGNTWFLALRYLSIVIWPCSELPLLERRHMYVSTLELVAKFPKDARPIHGRIAP
jgi:hypothetical protein